MYIRKLLTKLFAPLAFSRGGGGEAPPFAFRRRVGGEAVILICLSLTSCGLLDYDMEEGREELAVTMELGRDTMYVMTGDRFTFEPLFTPDTVNISDLYFYTDRPNILFFSTEGFEALEPGWAKVYAMSVSSRISDSCAVCVLEPWNLTVKRYPYETVIYAHVTVEGQPPTDEMIVAAFSGSEVRDFARVYEAHGTTFMIFRAGSEYRYTPDDEEPDFDLDDDEEPDDVPWTTQHEYISIRAYDPVHHRLYTNRTRILFDGESHGTPSQPLQIDLK